MSLDYRIRAQLEKRNELIINAVINKAKAVCPHSLALIGVYGSFGTEDIHLKSDLDLLIVINDDDGWKLSSCFILENVAHDIYCTTWESLEQMAEYRTPHISKLMDAKIVYCQDEKYLHRLYELRSIAKDIMDSPFSDKDIENTNVSFELAIKEYANVIISDEASKCRYSSAQMLYFIENTICMLNKTYFKKGVKRTLEELSQMKRLPEDFFEAYNNVLYAYSLEEIKQAATLLIKNIKQYLTEIEEGFEKPKKVADRFSLQGSYEEIYSNWYNKMGYAANHNDIHLSLMTAISCQIFYDEMYAEYDIEHYDLMTNYRACDLRYSARLFEEVMENYHKEYDKTKTRTKHYRSIEEFEKDYLS